MYLMSDEEENDEGRECKSTRITTIDIAKAIMVHSRKYNGTFYGYNGILVTFVSSTNSLSGILKITSYDILTGKMLGEWESGNDTCRFRNISYDSRTVVIDAEGEARKFLVPLLHHRYDCTAYLGKNEIHVF